MFSNTRVFVDLIDTTFELELNNMEAKNEIELLANEEDNLMEPEFIPAKPSADLSVFASSLPVF